MGNDDALEPKTLSVKARDWMSNALMPIIVAIVIGFGASYLTVRVNVAVLEEKNKASSEQSRVQSKLAAEQNKSLTEEIKELRQEMRCYMGQMYTKDEHSQYNEMIVMRFKDYTGKFIDFRSVISDHASRLRSLETEARKQ